MDGFFRETKEKVAYRKSEGCSVVEMECSALAACAAFRSSTWGMLLYTADSLADVQRYDQRHWGGSAYEYAPPCVSTPFWPSDPKFPPSADVKEALS